MNIETTADQAIADTRASVQAAIESLAKVCISRCRGWEDFRGDYRQDLLDSLNSLIQVRDKLK